MEKKFVDIKELSEIIHLGVATINKLIRKAKIPSYKIGKRRLFKLEEIMQWMETYKEDK